jgi:hypothetical protein
MGLLLCIVDLFEELNRQNSPKVTGPAVSFTKSKSQLQMHQDPPISQERLAFEPGFSTLEQRPIEAAGRTQLSDEVVKALKTGRQFGIIERKTPRVVKIGKRKALSVRKFPS